MNKLKAKLQTFFYSFKRSLVDISYYPHIVKTKFSFSVKYLFVFIYFLILFQSLFFAGATLVLLPKTPEFVKHLKTRIRTFYPSELIVNIRNGNLSTNVQNPYYIEIPELNNSDEENTYRHTITIDTKASIDDYKKYNTLLLVTQKALVYPDRDGRDTTKVTYFGKSKPIQLDKNKYDAFLTKYLHYLDYMPTVMIVLMILGVFLLPFVITPFVVLGKMLYLLILALCMWLVSQIFKNNLSYKKVYQLGIHALTLPILLTSLLSLFGVHISFLYTATLALWMVIILSKIREDSKKI